MRAVQGGERGAPAGGEGVAGVAAGGHSAWDGQRLHELAVPLPGVPGCACGWEGEGEEGRYRKLTVYLAGSRAYNRSVRGARPPGWRLQMDAFEGFDDTEFDNPCEW